MQIRVGIVVQEKALADTLVKSVIAFSLRSASSLQKSKKAPDVEVDISLYENRAGSIMKGYENLDLAIFDSCFLEENGERLWEIYQANVSCLPVVVLEQKESILGFLKLRPIGCVTNRCMEEQINEICNFCADQLKTSPQVFQLNTKKGSFAISVPSILYCQSDLKYVMIITKAGDIFRKLGKLDDIAGLLPSNFLRVHQSFLVNPSHISCLDKTAGMIVLDQGDKLPVSRNYRASVDALFQNCHFNC